jgi:hypothetical protein
LVLAQIDHLAHGRDLLGSEPGVKPGDRNSDALGDDADERDGVVFEDLADPHELHQIQPPLPDLDLGDPGVVFAESLGQSTLAQASVFAGLAQKCEELLVGGGMD